MLFFPLQTSFPSPNRQNDGTDSTGENTETHTVEAHARPTSLDKHVLALHTCCHAVSPLVSLRNAAEVGSKKDASTRLYNTSLA